MFVLLFSCIILGIRADDLPVLESSSAAEETPCTYPLDVVFLIDGSSSVEEIDFLKIKNFTKILLSKFLVSPSNTRVGVIEFASSVGTQIELKDSTDYGFLMFQLDGISKTGGDTQTHLALQDMIRMFNESQRQLAHQVAVCITDGKSRYPNSTKFYADKAKTSGITIFAIGKDGASFRDELEFIATGSSYVDIVQDFDSLPTDLASRLCTVAASSLGSTTTPSTTCTTETTDTMMANNNEVTPGSNGLIDNNRYYTEDINDCTKFYVTFDVLGQKVTVQQQCPFGLFWSQYLYTCSHPFSLRIFSMKCKNDPCSGVNLLDIPMTVHCGGYWRCNHGQTHDSGCCGLGRSFDFATQKCTNNPLCTHPCVEVLKLTDDCNKMAIPGNLTHYMEYIKTHNANVTRPCAAGSGFNQSSCECSLTIDNNNSGGTTIVDNTGCRTVFYLPILTTYPAMDGFVDESGNQHIFFHRDVTIVTIGNEVMAYFNGVTSFCNIWRFASVDYRKVHIRLTFRPNSSADGAFQKEEAILSNCYYVNQCAPSMALTIDRHAQNVMFWYLYLHHNTTRSISVPYIPDTSNAVILVIEDSYILLSVNGNERKAMKHASDVIKSSPSGFILGAGGGLNNFNGYLDEFKVEDCL